MAVDVQVIATQPAPAASDSQVAEQLRAAADLQPGSELISALDAVDIVRLDAADRIKFLALLQRAHNWLTGSMMLAVAAAAGPLPGARPDPSPDPASPTGDMHEDLVCAEVGAALNLTPGATASLITRARGAVGPLRAINERLLAGEWGENHLRRAVDATADTQAALACVAAENVTGRLRRPERCTPITLRNRLQRELAVLAPGSVAERSRAKRRNRGAQLHTDGDFRGRLEVDGPWPELNWTFSQLTNWAEQRLELLRKIRKAYPQVMLCCAAAVSDAVALLGDSISDTNTPINHAGVSGIEQPDGTGRPSAKPALDQCPWCGATDDRLPTLSQLRADALTEAVRTWSAQRRSIAGKTSQGLENPLPRRGRRWRHAIVVCDLATALGLSDNPGWVPGYGHVPGSLARELAAQASHWRRFLLDDNEKLIDIGRHTYRPSDVLREIVTARDQSCTFPGCARPACEADLDHVVNFDGANSTKENLHSLCRTHHRLKTHGGWRVSVDNNGWHHWTSPLGRRYSRRVVPPWLDP